MVQRRELDYANRHATAIEINGTYYGTQKPATYATWRDEVPPGFVFSAKAPRRITQARKLAGTKAPVEDFIGGIVELSDTLGPLVWQFEQGHRLQADDLDAFFCHCCPSVRARVRCAMCWRFATAMRWMHRCWRWCAATVWPRYSPIRTSIPRSRICPPIFVYARLMRSQARLHAGYPAPALARWAERIQAWRGGDDPADLPHVDASAAPARQPREVFVFFSSVRRRSATLRQRWRC
ncbi:DUF72 domain-containing protein [Xanthomonas oryzae pv. oryzae]|nr:DUF72 domain-containing protein [Xanthomonas oryzae pv. oryzae]